MLVGFYVLNGSMVDFNNWKKEQEKKVGVPLFYAELIQHGMNDETIFTVCDKRITPQQAGKFWATMWSSVPDEPDELHDMAEIAINDSYILSVSEWRFDKVTLLSLV